MHRSACSAQSSAPSKVSQDSSVPLRTPRLNQRTRCSELPWVKDSGTTRPRDWRCRRSSPILLAARARLLRYRPPPAAGASGRRGIPTRRRGNPPAAPAESAPSPPGCRARAATRMTFRPGGPETDWAARCACARRAGPRCCRCVDRVSTASAIPRWFTRCPGSVADTAPASPQSLAGQHGSAVLAVHARPGENGNINQEIDQKCPDPQPLRQTDPDDIVRLYQ